MAMYRYTFKKYLKSKSTWVILVLTTLMVFLLVTFLPFKDFDSARPDAPIKYAEISIPLIAGLTQFLSIFVSVFSGFKAATMYKDEVEDGTFLILLSKPITRSKIILYKWLALQSIIVLYTFLTSLAFLSSILIADKGGDIPGLSALGIETLTSNVFGISIFTWLILMISGLIFSSIALLLSTRLSVGATIGIAVALGVVIPITSLVGTFTKRRPFEAISNGNSIIFKRKLEAALGLESQMGQKILNIPDTQSNYQDIYSEVDQLIDDTNNHQIGISTGDTDSFKYSWIFDLNFQIGALASYASEQAVPDAIKSTISSATSGAPGLSDSTTAITSDNIFSNGINNSGDLEQFEAIVNNRWEAIGKTRDHVLTKLILPILQTVNITSEFKITNFKFIHSINEIIKFHNQMFPSTSQLNLVDKNTSINNALFHILATDIFSMISNAMKSNPATSNQGAEQLAVSYSILLNLFDIIEKYSVNMESTTFTEQQNGNSIDGVIRLISLGKDVIIPMKTWFESGAIQRVLRSEGISLNTSIAPTYQNENGIIPVSMRLLQEDKSVNAHSNYIYVASFLNDSKYNHSIANIKSVKYVHREWILLAYLLLALSLVPLSYFIVRKQDFR